MKTGRMLLVSVLAILAMLFVLAGTGCGGQGPSDVALDFNQKVNNRQFGDMYDSLSSGSPIRKEQSKDDWIRLNESTFPEGFQLADFKVTDENIDGDKATVLWSATAKAPERADEATNGTLIMVKEDDVWKIEK